MMREPLPGTVKLYHRHLYVCTGRIGWPAHIEEDGGFLQALAEEAGRRTAGGPVRFKINACDAPSLAAANVAADGQDILVFPDSVRYVGVRAADLPALLDDLLGGSAAGPLARRPLPGWHVFVCVHGERDERCGQCGPPLAARFRAELAARGLAEAVAVHRSSHVGGHRYAGNVIIYPGGDWYGYVTPADVPELIEQHLQQGRVVAGHWRGRLGLAAEEQVRLAATL